MKIVDFRKIFTKKRIMFIVLFGVLALIAKQINFSALVGADQQYLTLFQFFGPIAGSFLGPIFGIISVLGAELAGMLIVGKAFSFINIIRLTPMLFAAWYFGAKKIKLSAIIPAIAMLFFIAHPIGKQAWVYSLFWLIPIVIAFTKNKNLFLRSLGATFTAHSIGAVAFLYTVPMTAGQWVALIPITAMERLMFAAGITISYVVFNALFDKVKAPTNIIFLNRLSFLSKKVFGIRL